MFLVKFNDARMVEAIQPVNEADEWLHYIGQQFPPFQFFPNSINPFLGLNPALQEADASKALKSFQSQAREMALKN